MLLFGFQICAFCPTAVNTKLINSQYQRAGVIQLLTE